MLIRKTLHRIEKSLFFLGIKSAESLDLPDFLGIGAQKAGSTWLYENLKRHPEIFMPAEKELHYFDRHFSKPLKTYSRFFKPNVNKVKGEITPAYSLLSNRRIKFIKRIMPDVKLILVLRNPIDRIWSQTLMNLVSQQKRRFSDIKEDEFIRYFRREKFQMRSRYSQILDSWLAVFPDNQMKVCFFDDISLRPKELLLTVFEFLGVSQEIDWDTFPYQAIVHKGSRHPLPKTSRAFLEELLFDEMVELEKRFGELVSHWRASDKGLPQ